jgi:hypothetical protein
MPQADMYSWDPNHVHASSLTSLIKMIHNVSAYMLPPSPPSDIHIGSAHSAGAQDKYITVVNLKHIGTLNCMSVTERIRT